MTPLGRWRHEYAADEAQAFPGKGKLKPRDEELAALKRELHLVQQERDILKKAMAAQSRMNWVVMFAREQR